MNNKKEPKIHELDLCLKYVPRHNFQSFLSEVQITDKQIFNYLPSTSHLVYKNFQSTRALVSIGFWATTLSFISFCHKIKLIERIFPNKWAMFAFKIASFIGPFYLYGDIQTKAQEQNCMQIYSLIKEDYRKYVNTGDILALNPMVQLTEISWKNPLSESQLQIF